MEEVGLAGDQSKGLFEQESEAIREDLEV